MFETVLFPLEQRNQVLEMVKEMVAFAAEHASCLSLLSVVGVLDSPEARLSDDQTQLLRQIQLAVEGVGVPCTVMESPVHSAAEICSLASELNVDVIVMGLQGLSAEQEQDSTALNVIQHSPCPVLVVP